MGGVKTLIGLTFLATLGFLFLFLACALPAYNNWYPFFVVFFYVLAPLPALVSRRSSAGIGSGSSPLQELCAFFTAGLVLSAFALPIVLARAPPTEPTVAPGAAGLVEAANVIFFATLFGFFYLHDRDDFSDYSAW
jgi:hypothetical protein